MPTAVRQRVLGFTLVLTAIAYLDRVCISMAAPAMKADLGISDVQMGWVFSAFTLAYAVFEVPSGYLADRFGARLMLTRIVVWWSALTAITGAAWSFASLLVIRFLFGVGEAGAFPSMARTYARWLPARERGRAFGLTLMAGALGGAATQPLVVALLEWMHWRHTFYLFGAVGVLWAAAWFAWFRDDPHQHRGVDAAELALIGSDPPAPHRAVPWGALLRDRNLWALCAMYLFAIYGWYFYLTWLPTYLLRARGFDLRHVGWLAALPLLSIAAGVLVGGWLSDVLTRRWGARAGRRTPGVIGMPLAALAIVAGITTPTAETSALCFAAAAGLAALGVSPAWAVCLEIGGRHAGVVSGAMNTFGNLGGALSPVVIGFGLERWGGWGASLGSIAVCYVLAALCWLLIDPTRPIVAAAQR
ncbi:MAG: MFS transporter [Deltaproteobacteria bacterium]|nr:MFS transporter [Deltaproteobacteria bacterium]